MLVCLLDIILVKENKKDNNMKKRLIFKIDKHQVSKFQLQAKELSVLSRVDFVFEIVRSFFKLDRQKIKVLKYNSFILLHVFD